jgi:hypothetical protein
LKKIILACIILLSLISGCTAVSPVEPNEIPVAYIDSVSATTAVLGDVVNFSGHGTDKEGSVVAYQWRSSIDGVLSTMADFSTSTLSVAKHTIYFQVQDNRGDWSKEVYVFVNVVPTHIGIPIINVFQAKPDYIQPGESAVLTWDVAYADTVVISPDIGNVSLIGSRTVYPQKNMIYTVTATNDQGQTKADTMVGILVKQVKTVELYSIPEEDGTVKRSGEIEFDPMAGETSSSLPMQAFLSFDISVIPDTAQIQNVSFDISNHATYGLPFNFLGAMGIFHDQYGTLDSNDYVIGYPGNAMYSVYSEPWQPYSSNLFTDSMQGEVNKGSNRFQIRLQFANYYYGSGQANYIALQSNKVKVTVSYLE